MAVGVWLAALLPTGSSRVAVLGVVAVGLSATALRRPTIVIAAAILAASLAAGAAWARVEPVTPRAFSGEAVLASDPKPAAGGVRVDATVDGVRYDLRAWGSAAGHLRPRLMGERVRIDADLRPLDDPPLWLLARGVGGRGTVTHVDGFDTGGPHTRVANSLRRTIEAGAASMTRDEQSLFAGLVYGDDRAQSPLVADNFTAAGLSHLLAVSGQNVAFVLAIVGPALRRMGNRSRFATVLVVLGLFATVTRFEPSVIRASAMAAVAATGALVGAQVSARRVLGLAITALVLVDPLVVHSVAFQLSVAASAGILFWSARVARAIPGPRPLVESLAVTATAQVAVGPLVVWRFGGLPVASLPANLLAGPAAGPVMMWGLTGGVVAGLTPSWLAAILHLPSRLVLGWIDGVAASAALLPLGELGMVHIVVLFAAGWFGLTRWSTRGRAAAVFVVVAALAHPGLVMASAPASTVAIDAQSVLWRDATTTVLELSSSSNPETVLREVRRSGVSRLDLVVVDRASFGHADLVGWISERHDIGEVWAPEATMGVGEQIPPSGIAISIGDRRLSVVQSEGTLRLDEGETP